MKNFIEKQKHMLIYSNNIVVLKICNCPSYFNKISGFMLSTARDILMGFT